MSLPTSVGHRSALTGCGDLTRTVGRFTAVAPVLLDLRGEEGPAEVLAAVKGQLRHIPRGGLGHGLLRYGPDADLAGRLAAQPAAEVRFDYLGDLDRALPPAGPLALAPEAAAVGRAAARPGRYLLEVSARVAGSRLHLAWAYAGGAYEQATVEKLARSAADALRAIVAHCRAPGAGDVRAADFPESGLTDEELQQLLGKLG